MVKQENEQQKPTYLVIEISHINIQYSFTHKHSQTIFYQNYHKQSNKFVRAKTKTSTSGLRFC